MHIFGHINYIYTNWVIYTYYIYINMGVWKPCEFMSSDWCIYLNVMSDLIITFISLFKELEAKEKAIEEERQALRRQIIEEERQRLLKRHATKLLGYLPKV